MSEHAIESKIRVSIPSDLFAGETVWVSVTGKGRGIVDNVCACNPRITLGDEIYFRDGDGLPRLTRIAKRGPMGMMRFVSTETASEDDVKGLVDGLVALGVAIEGMRLGSGKSALYGIAVPLESMARAKALVEESAVVDAFEVLRPATGSGDQAKVGNG